MKPPETIPPPAEAPRRPRHWLWTAGSIALLVVVLVAAIIHVFAYTVIKMLVESSAGQRYASVGLGRAIKVEGEFTPLHLNEWTITTDSFTSKGWPGEAIGGLNAYGIAIEIDPAGPARGVWRIKGIQIDHADFTLLQPNDALKRQVIKKPKPWYGYFLPSKFECGPIVTPHGTVNFELGGLKARILDAHIQADLIKKDFNYTVDSGTAEMPFLPPLRIVKLGVFVTRPLVTVSDAQLVALDPADPAKIQLSGSMGMRENKSLDANVELADMPIAQVLPAELQPLIHGRASGHVVWRVDKTGKKFYGEGEITLKGAAIDDLSVFKQLALLHGNPDLQSFDLDRLTVKFKLEDDVFKADIVANSPGKFSLTGMVSYELKTKIADLNLAFTGLPLKVWMPSEFKPRYSGVGSSTLRWRGRLDSFKDSTGAVSLNLDGAHIHNPVLLRKFVAKKGLHSPDELDFKTAQLDFTYQDQTFNLTRAVLDAPGIVNLQAKGTLTTPDYNLDAVVTWQDLKLENWLPSELAEQIIGNINGGVKLRVHQWQMKDGSYAGDVQLVQGELRYTSVQSMLARFVGDRRLLDVPLTRASFSWAWKAGALSVGNIDLRGDDSLGVQGDLALSASGKLSGLLGVGIRPVYLKAFLGLGNNVFSRDDAGLCWAQVKLSGTAKAPKQDLASQLIGQLGNHPLSVFGLGGKMISWYVGNLFGAKKEWERPAVAP